ncbi:MAG: chemotaxis response regulator protein-glutamate methylesterase [Nitrospira sp.]|nr:MAG: chemotaxis response regulator protein-glutamate methylesterase [Nitrospira sp.]
MSTRTQVLVVDDSALMRKVLSEMLEKDPRISVVGTARNGEEAIQKVAELHPDVVTMDVAMSVMNGLEALRRLMATTPLPVLMVSSLTEAGAKETLSALEMGAVDYLPKHVEGVTTNTALLEQELIGKVLAAAGAKVTRRSALQNGGSPAKAIAKPMAPGALTASPVGAIRGATLVAIGCSTGGPLALQAILPLFPADFPAAVLIVQHMPKYFTKPFAERLDQLCQITVKEAVEGDVVRPGVALVAPGGVQMRVARTGSIDIEIRLSKDGEGLLHAPSVDVMMNSVAELYSGRGIGVILTGMGRDGCEGMRAIKGTKGRTIAQNEATCAVYGMPKTVVDAGLADKVVPLTQIAGEILKMV